MTREEILKEELGKIKNYSMGPGGCMKLVLERDIKMTKEQLLSQKREKLFRSLAVIHVTAKIQEIAYFDAIKGSNFRNPKIKAKSDLLQKHSEDIIKSLGNAVRLKEEHAEYMEYSHFTEVYELLTKLLFIDTQSIRNLTKVLNGEITGASEEEVKEIIEYTD